MKQFIMILMVASTLTATAQRGGQRIMKNLTAEESATLKTKKMTLDLALNQSQADEVYQLNLNQAHKRKTMQSERKSKSDRSELTSQERFQKKNDFLDSKIAFQNEMKSILNEDQFKLWRRQMAQKKKRNHYGRRGPQRG